VIPRPVHIHYLRPPDRLEVFHQTLVHEDASVLVTLARNVELREPVVVDGRVVLEPGSDAVWFTFPGVWHDIGRFHTRDGRFTGIYANVLTPPEIREGDEWHTTDLFLDVWLDPNGNVRVLDEDELERARAQGWVDRILATRARIEARELREWAEAGTWPPPIVSEWTRERALQVLAAAASDESR